MPRRNPDRRGSQNTRLSWAALSNELIVRHVAAKNNNINRTTDDDKPVQNREREDKTT